MKNELKIYKSVIEKNVNRNFAITAWYQSNDIIDNIFFRHVYVIIQLQLLEKNNHCLQFISHLRYVNKKLFIAQYEVVKILRF